MHQPRGRKLPESPCSEGYRSVPCQKVSMLLFGGLHQALEKSKRNGEIHTQIQWPLRDTHKAPNPALARTGGHQTILPTGAELFPAALHRSPRGSVA